MRSQRALRERRGYDSSGDTAYNFGDRSNLTEQEQYVAAVTAGFSPPLPATAEAPVNFILPSISLDTDIGIDAVGTASPGTWAGNPEPTFEYQWFRGGDSIDGANTDEYTLQGDDVGELITVQVTASNTHDDVMAESAAIGPVPSLPINFTAPVITGTAQEGETLTASTGVWIAYPAPTYTYSWKRDGVGIGGATASTYELVLADVGTVITVEVGATNTLGDDAATSDPTATVIGA